MIAIAQLVGTLRTDEPAATSGQWISKKYPLTKREREVLYLVAEGLTTKEIASRLQITFKTAGCHRERILQKLKVSTTVSAVRWAIREGLSKP